MIAPIRLTTSTCDPERSQDRFVAMLPQIQKQIDRSFRHLPPEFREELTQEVIAQAFCGYTALVRRGKEDLAYATPLTQYAIRRVYVGRQVGCRLNVRDITSRRAQLAHGITIRRLDRYDSRKGCWREVLVEDRNATPADVAAARIDVASWLKSLPRRDRKVAKVLARGESTTEASRMFGVSLARISQLRRELQESWDAFQSQATAM